MVGLFVLTRRLGDVVGVEDEPPALERSRRRYAPPREVTILREGPGEGPWPVLKLDYRTPRSRSAAESA